MNETQDKDAPPPMSADERKKFTGGLFEKLSFVRGVAAQGKDVSAAENAVTEQIRDTIINGNPKKA